MDPNVHEVHFEYHKKALLEVRRVPPGPSDRPIQIELSECADRIYLSESGARALAKILLGMVGVEEISLEYQDH